MGGSYGSGEALSSGVTGIISGSAVISTDRSYVAKLVITDSLGNTAEFEDSIPTERVAFHLKEGGNGAAFGKAAETEYVLELAEDWELKGGKKAGAGILQTTAATDLNAAAEKIAVLDGDGTVRYRTPAELLADLGADYIVEQGISGGWRYRKWASGLAECWGEVAANTAITEALGAMYMVVTDYFSWPDALFSAPPRIVQAAPITTAPLLPIIRGGDTTKNQFRMYLLYPDIYEGTINWVIGVEAKARWK